MATVRDVCEDCIWWKGDNSGMQGECMDSMSDTPLVIGRYENCSQFLTRYLSIPIGEKNV